MFNLNASQSSPPLYTYWCNKNIYNPRFSFEIPDANKYKLWGEHQESLSTFVGTASSFQVLFATLFCSYPKSNASLEKNIKSGKTYSGIFKTNSGASWKKGFLIDRICQFYIHEDGIIPFWDGR